jgi:hypothetical protein
MYHVRQHDIFWQDERPSARHSPNEGKIMEKLPATETALLQHANRCIYQASIWRNSLKPMIAAPNPEGFGWAWEDTGWLPVWTTLPAAACCRFVENWSHLVAMLNPLVRRNADAKPPGSHAQHSVSAVDFLRVKNKLTVAAHDELVNNGGAS